MVKTIPNGVLTSATSSTYPKGSPAVWPSAAALLDDHFDHPAQLRGSSSSLLNTDFAWPSRDGACLCMLLSHAVLVRSLYPRPALDLHACKY